MTKLAAAPISWGVSELAEWGFRMAPERVLSEMQGLGFAATELGPPGFLPVDPEATRQLLRHHALRLVGGFLAIVLHDSSYGAVDAVASQAEMLAAAGGEVLVLAAALPGGSYNHHQELSAIEWRTLVDQIAAAERIAGANGLRLALHPHAGTAVASWHQVETLLARTDVGLCLDTGHLAIGGVDPVDLVRDQGARINHVHLKDVDLGLAAGVRSDRISYVDAVRAGLYRPLGQGGLDIEAVLARLKEAGYDSWFVLEQDTALTADPEPESGPRVAARQSLDYFRQISYGCRNHTW